MGAIVKNNVFQLALMFLSAAMVCNFTLAATYYVSTEAATSFDTVSSRANLSDNQQKQLNTGFTFYLGTVGYTKTRVSSNGLLHFGTNENMHNEFTNRSLPTTVGDRIVAVYWDDLDPGSGGEVYSGMLGSAPNRRFVVWWDGVPHNTAGGSYNFQAVIYETGQIRFRYGTGNGDGASATVGVEIDDSDSTEYLYDSATLSSSVDLVFWPYEVTSVSAYCGSDQLEVDFASAVPQATMETTSYYRLSGGGTVTGATQNDTNTVTLDTSGLSAGSTYTLTAFGVDTSFTVPSVATVGLVGTYFDQDSGSGKVQWGSGGAFTGATFTRTDGTVDFDWGSGEAISGSGTSDFSVQWNGFVTTGTSGSYTFQTLSDDGVRLWVDGVLLIDNWSEHGVTTDTSSVVTLSAGVQVPIRLQYFERSGNSEIRLQWSNPDTTGFIAIPQIQLGTCRGSIPILESVSSYCSVLDQLILDFDSAIDATAAVNASNYSLSGGATVSSAVLLSSSQVLLNTSTLTAGQVIDVTAFELTVDHIVPVSSGDGITGAYYDQYSGWSKVRWDAGGAFTGGVTVRTDTNIDFNWGWFFPFWSIGFNDWSIRWIGEIVPSETGNHIFRTLSDDGVRLWVDGDLIIDNWTSHAATYDTASAMSLTAGESYPIKLEYFERNNTAQISLEWTPPSGSGFVAVPGNQMKVCVTESVSSIDHFVMSYNEFAINCVDETVTVTAYDSSGSIFTDFTDQVTLNTNSGKGSWTATSGSGSLVDTTANDGVAVYTFDASDMGTTTFTLEYQEGDSVLDIDAYLTSDTGIRDDDSEAGVTFAPTGFTVTQSVYVPPADPTLDPIVTQIAAVDFYVNLTAYGQTPADTTCGVIEAYDGVKALSFWMDYENPTSGGIVAKINTVNVATSSGAASDQSVTFASGKAQLTMNYTDVGLIQLHMDDDSLVGGSTLSGSSNQFVVKPAQFGITVSGGVGASDAMDDTGTVFIKAGRNFTVTVEAQTGAGAATPNYGRETSSPETVLLTGTMVAPGSAGSAITLGNGSSFTNGGSNAYQGSGVFIGDNLYYDNVGIINIIASVADTDYLGVGDISTTQTNVGRFIPNHFGVTGNVGEFRAGLGAWSCDFTYQGQTFELDSVNQPTVTVAAVTYLNNPATLYIGDYWKLGAALTKSFSDQTISNALLVGPAASSDTVSISSIVSGAATYTFGGNEMRYDRDSDTAVSGDEPFNVDIDLIVNAGTGGLTDSDGVCYDVDTNGSCDTFTLSSIPGPTTGSNNLYYGRMVIDNSSGSELLPLSMSVRAEYWNSSFIVNADDDCSVSEVLGFTISDLTSPLVSGDLAHDSMAGGLRAGEGVLILSSPSDSSVGPGLGNDGQVKVDVLLPSFLQFDFSGDGSGTNPSAVATFGVYGVQSPIIFMREDYR